MARFEVYKHTSPSGRAYVGWTSQGSTRRWYKHVSDSRKGSDTAFHRAIRKYGSDAFAHELLEVMTTEAGAKRAEQLWIAELGTFGAGYNTTAGGDGAMGRVSKPAQRDLMREKMIGRHVSVETRRRVSVSLRAAHERDPGIRERMSASHLGCRMSATAVAKTAAAHRGRKRSAETRANISAAMRRVRGSRGTS